MTGVLGATGPTVYWYATRGSGVVALLLLSAAFVLGALGPVGFRTRRWPRFLVGGLHRNVTLLAVVFVAIHVVTTVLDGYAPIGIKDAFVPFLSSYRTLWLGLGTVALDLAAALVVTSLLRARVGMRAWRAVHWLAYASWPLAVLHALGTGSDARFGWLATLAYACTAAVVLALLWRLASSRLRVSRRVLAGGAALGLVLVGSAWYRGGPQAKGWAKRAGTPTPLLASARSATAAARASAPASAPAPAATLPALPFSSALVGRFAQAGPDSNGLLSIEVTGIARGAADAELRLDLWGTPLDGGGVAMQASRVSFGPPGDPRAYTGKIVGLQGERVLVGLHDAAGRTVDLALVLRIDAASGSVAGNLRASTGGGE